MINYTYVNRGINRTFNSIREPKKLTKKFSIVIPTYNEEGCIPRLARKIHDTLKNIKKSDYEIIIVDDSSRDKTPEIIDNLAANSNIVALHREGAEGIFSAIRDGIKTSRGKIVVMMDADFSHPPFLIPKLISHMKDYDLVSGSRFAQGGGVEAPFLRKFGTIILNKLCRIILSLKPKDLTGGFHAIRKEAFQKMKFEFPTIFGEFDMELFIEAKKLGLKVKEIPFVYKFRLEGKTKVDSIIGYGLHYFFRAIQLRIYKRY